MALDELQDQKSFGAHWSRLGDVRWNKKHCGPFQEQFPCKLQVIIKKTFQVPWEFKAYFGEWISSFVRYGENNIFSKRSKHWRGFPPDGLFMLGWYQEFWNNPSGISKQSRQFEFLRSKTLKVVHQLSPENISGIPWTVSQPKSFIQHSSSWTRYIKFRKLIYIYKWFLEGVYLNKIYKNSSAQSMLCKEKKTYAPSR